MMDALDSLQGSSLDSKAERIARYKAERRRELAERYADLEESSSLYTRREKNRETTDTSELKKTDVSSVLSQYSKDGSALSRQGDRSNSEAKTDATPFSNMFVSHSDENNQVTCSRQHHSLLEAEEAQNTQDDRKADDDAKTGMPAKMSLLKGLEKTNISANPKNQAEDNTNNAKPQREHISEKRTVSTSHFSSDEGEKSSDEKKDLREGEEKISCFQSSTAGEENVKNKEDENVIEKTVTQNEQKVRKRQCFEGTEEPKAATPVLQRQDSGQRSIKGILKKSHSTSLDIEPTELEQITTPAIKTCKELTVADGKKGKNEEVEDDEEDRENRRLQREESSSSETPRTPSPDSVDKTPPSSQSVEGDELDSSLDGSMSSSLKERLAELDSGDDDWRGKLKNKLTNVVQSSLADRYVQLQESEKAWRKK